MTDSAAAPEAGTAASATAEKVALIGFMGAGKSTAARSLGTAAADVDDAIEARCGRSIAEIFAQDGEPAFRELEEQVTLDLLADPAVQVVALGGGAVSSERVRRALAGVRVVWLDLDAELAWERVAGNRGVPRPLARDRRQFDQLLAQREPLYAELADVVVPATRAASLARVLNAAIALKRKQATMLWAVSTSAEYPVYIGSGLVTATHFWPPALGGRRVVISDQNVAPHYGTAFNPTLASVNIPAGERSKTLAQAERVWSEMALSGATRSDIVVALGGGVVGDLAGFCAATYQRGVRVVQVPTTLLAQVDSAYGGKTGVDLPQAKNYVGAFHQPAAVITDPATLASLPAAEIAAGYAEVVKTGLLAGGALWQLIRDGARPDDPRVIAGCALTKLRVVGGDERDGGRRQTLNLGHTVAHAIETVTGYSRYRHGEAVALGLLAALRLSGADELREEVGELLANAGLPATLDPSIDIGELLRATARDKKRLGEAPVPFVLCSTPGHAVYGQQIKPSELESAVQELLA